MKSKKGQGKELCSCPCSPYLSPMNLVIGAILFTLILYVLAETTNLFENLQQFFLGKSIDDGRSEPKSIQSFIESHYMFLCLIGPVIGLTITAVYFLGQR